VIFVGIDWSERHHDICVVDVDGTQLARTRVPEGIEGVAKLHETLAEHAEKPQEVIVGIETDRGLLVAALVAAGYQVFAINPLSVDRYRDRRTTSGAKSDPGDAKVLADIVRTDRGNHRPVAGDSELAEGIKLLAQTEGIFAETAGGVTIGVLRKMVKQGIIKKGDVTVAYITGNGLKTQEPLMGRLGQAVRIKPTLASFETNLAGRLSN